jgi:hypothetical protein
MLIIGLPLLAVKVVSLGVNHNREDAKGFWRREGRHFAEKVNFASSLLRGKETV